MLSSGTPRSTGVPKQGTTYAGRRFPRGLDLGSVSEIPSGLRYLQRASADPARLPERIPGRPAPASRAGPQLSPASPLPHRLVVVPRGRTALRDGDHPMAQSIREQNPRRRLAVGLRMPLAAPARVGAALPRLAYRAAARRYRVPWAERLSAASERPTHVGHGSRAGPRTVGRPRACAGPHRQCCQLRPGGKLFPPTRLVHLVLSPKHLSPSLAPSRSVPRSPFSFSPRAVSRPRAAQSVGRRAVDGGAAPAARRRSPKHSRAARCLIHRYLRYHRYRRQ